MTPERRAELRKRFYDRCLASLSREELFALLDALDAAEEQADEWGEDASRFQGELAGATTERDAVIARLESVRGVCEKLFGTRDEKALHNAEVDISAAWEERDAALKRVAELEGAALAYRELSTCYRLGKRPSEKLFARLERARKALKDGT